MLSIPGKPGSTCDGFSRREFIRVGGAGMFGVSLAQILQLEALAADKPGPKPKASAKSVIFVFLQGGPSHIDIWDPKPDAPERIRGKFKPIPTTVSGIQLSETMPRLAKQLHRATLIRSVSYTPKGLFNHTAAMYQMLTGYTPDKVSPSGQLEPPNRKDFPNFGCQIARMRPPEVPMLPFVMLPRVLKESSVVQKAGTAGFLGPAWDPYYMFQDPNKPINLSDLTLRADVGRERMQKRRRLLDEVNALMPEIDRAVKKNAINRYYEQALDLVISGRARDAFDLSKEADKTRNLYGRTTFGQALLIARRLVEAGTRVVQVNWPAQANGDPTKDAFDTHKANFGPLQKLHCPKLDPGLAGLLQDLDERGLLQETLVVAIGEFGRSPRLGVSTSGNGNGKDGRDHWPYCYTALIAGGGVKRGSQYGASDATASSPKENPVHPRQILATVYHAMGIDSRTIIYTHLNQPRELVQAEPILDLFG